MIEESNKDEIGKIIENLVKVNLLRYQADGSVTWHNKIIWNVAPKEISIMENKDSALVLLLYLGNNVLLN